MSGDLWIVPLLLGMITITEIRMHALKCYTFGTGGGYGDFCVCSIHILFNMCVWE